MPVLRFEAPEDAFQILEDHFEKVWVTPDLTREYVGDRMADKEYYTGQIFNQRGRWLRKVSAVLRYLDVRERREKGVIGRKVLPSTQPLSKKLNGNKLPEQERRAGWPG
jgi:hypothetical protein